MIENLVTLASYGYYGGVGEYLSQLEQYGFFSYVLPFLLIFALVFGILSVTKIFQENKAVNGIIALVIGLMSLQFDMVPRFFAELFPRFGIGLAVILIVLILLGLFMPKQNWMAYVLFGVATLVLIIVLVKTAGSIGWYGGYWWSDNWQLVAGAIFILVVIGIIVGASNPSTEKVETPLFKKLFEK